MLARLDVSSLSRYLADKCSKYPKERATMLLWIYASQLLLFLDVMPDIISGAEIRVLWRSYHSAGLLVLVAEDILDDSVWGGVVVMKTKSGTNQMLH